MGEALTFVMFVYDIFISRNLVFLNTLNILTHLKIMSRCGTGNWEIYRNLGIDQV